LNKLISKIGEIIGTLQLASNQKDANEIIKQLDEVKGLSDQAKTNGDKINKITEGLKGLEKLKNNEYAKKWVNNTTNGEVQAINELQSLDDEITAKIAEEKALLQHIESCNKDIDEMMIILNELKSEKKDENENENKAVDATINELTKLQNLLGKGDNETDKAKIMSSYRKNIETITKTLEKLKTDPIINKYPKCTSILERILKVVNEILKMFDLGEETKQKQKVSLLFRKVQNHSKKNSNNEIQDDKNTNRPSPPSH